MLARALLFLLLLVTPTFAWTHGLPYYGPCDVISGGCAEAYSVTRAMTASYSGPLFQLSNGSSTLDIGQVNHSADLSTWSAFCGGVQSNCVYSKLYAQINSANTLQPNSSAKAPFAISSDNNLPIINTTVVNAEYDVPGDPAGVGINGGSTPTSVVYVGVPITQTYCCGLFGISHSVHDSDTPGTDFLVMLAYGTYTNPNFSNCGTEYCAGVEEEQKSDTAIYSATLIANAVVVITLSNSGGTVAAWLNSHALFNRTPPLENPIVAGTSIHFSHGGDTSFAPSIMREGMITNTTMSSGDQAAALANIEAFYSGLSFP
jgi:alpha-L-arabinofuranosidase B-like protein